MTVKSYAEQSGSTLSCEKTVYAKWLLGGQMDGWLLLRREEMGEIINSKIRKKDKIVGDGKEGGISTWASQSVCSCQCVSMWGKDMKRETDRQNCMSWLVSCSLIRMQISCIEKHLGAFLRLTCSSFSPHSSHPLSSFLCEIQTSFLHFPYFLLSLFSVYPPIFPIHFLLLTPLQSLFS